LRRSLLCGLVAAVSLAAPSWAASGIANITIAQNSVTASVQLPGDVTADLNLQFEQALGLTVESLGLSAKLVSPSDLGLAARLPTSASVPAGFPVLITIEAPSTGSLAFSGVVAIDLHTHNLTYTTNSPLRLFAAEAGTSFQDITGSTGLGSYRAGATKGGFSEFLIVADVRSVDTVIAEKFQRVQSVLDANASSIASAVLTTLRTTLSAARASYLASDALTASEKVEQFADTVKQNSGSSIPDVWRSARDVVNVAGDLRSGASTLKFSLLFKASGGS
jgi:uncharacterized protein DUF6689